MYRLTLINLIFVLLFSGQLHAQEYGAVIKDDQGNPIPYATIYQPRLRTGTISDAEGAFTVVLPSEADTSRLYISCLGYEKVSLPAERFRNLVRANNPVIMKPVIYDLKTSIVTAEKIDLRRDLLQLKSPLNATYGFLTSPDRMPIEQGTIFKPKKECRIDEVLLKLTKMDADSVLLDLNLYEYRSGKVGRPLLMKRVFVSLTKSETEGKIRVPLRDLDVITKKSFLVSLRVLKVVGERGKFSFPAKTGNNLGQRRVFGGNWENGYIAPAFEVAVSYLR